GDRPSSIQLSNLFKYKLLFEEIFNIAYSGDIIKAARLNGIAVAEILGYDTSIIKEALSAGALAAGITGNGPSIFAIVKEGEEGKIYDIFNREGNVIITRAVKIDSERFSVSN
ncbi:MAG: shikimate kinase, partial [Sulfolobaceae archaeon]